MLVFDQVITDSDSYLFNINNYIIYKDCYPDSDQQLNCVYKSTSIDVTRVVQVVSRGCATLFVTCNAGQ
jgi:hypothetical protein